MSVRVMAMVWDCEALPHKHRLMMLALADHAGDDGLAWPSLARLAKKCGINLRNTQKKLRELEEDGWISVAKSIGGQRNTNRYVLNLDALFAGAASTTMADPVAQDRNPVAQDTVAYDRNPVAQDTVDPVAQDRNPVAQDTVAYDRNPVARDANPVARDVRTLSHATPEPSLEPSENHQQTNPRARIARTDTLPAPAAVAPKMESRNTEPPGFKEWWDLYPKKCGKGAARPAYSKALDKVAGPWVLAEGLRAALPQLADLEPRFIPNPATWLNQERWLDQPPPKARGSVTRQIDGALAILHRMDDERRQP